MIRMTAAASSTFLAKQVTQSSDLHAGTTPCVDNIPTVGLIPTHPFNMAGTRPAQTAFFQRTAHQSSVYWPAAQLIDLTSILCAWEGLTVQESMLGKTFLRQGR